MGGFRSSKGPRKEWYHGSWKPPKNIFVWNQNAVIGFLVLVGLELKVVGIVELQKGGQS